MPIVILGRGRPVQVDFLDGIYRSAKGAIHLLPLGTREITGEELEHIRTAHPEVFKRLQVQAEAVEAPSHKAIPVSTVIEHKADSGKKTGAKNRE